MRDLTEQIFIELLRSYHNGIGVTHSASPQVEVAGHLAKEAAIMTAEFDSVTKDSAKSVDNSKPFDITNHKFSDGDITSAFITDKRDRINFNFDSDTMPTDTIGFNKLDLIFACKALGVTWEDLK